MSQLQPSEPRERIVVLDVLRGIALLGVLLGNAMNLYSGAFTGAFAGYEPTKLDIVAGWFVGVLVQSKAQTLLTFLFGFGFAAQLLRGEERGEPVTGLYVRRMVALAAFGMFHIAVFWWGDVLWTYALSGFAMLAFHRASNRIRVVAAVLLVVVPGAIMSLPGMREWSFTLLYEPDAWEVYTRDLSAAMRGSDHLALMWEHILFFPVFSAGGFLAYQPWLLGRFLLGYVAGSLRWFVHEGADHLPVFRRILLWGAITGAAGVTMTIFGILGVFRGYEPSVPRQIVLGVFRELNYLGLAAVYLAATVLLFQRRRWRRLLEVFAPTGRMPLTIYLSQSLIMTFLLYGWGLGWNEVLAPAAYVGLSFAVFAVQTIACHLWLRRYRFGPLEALWRAVVYLRWPQMRHQPGGR